MSKHKAIKNKLITLRGRKCQQCNKTKWLDKPINLELHHIKPPCNKFKNLLLLCPNCHSYTNNYKRKNINKCKNITDKQIIKFCKKSENIHQLLINLKLTPKGANYKTIRKRLENLNLLNKFKLDFKLSLCLNCGAEIDKNKKFCSVSCSNRFNAVLQKTKIIWPKLEVIEKMVEELGFSAAGRKLKVSDNAIRKRINKLRNNL